MAWAPGCVQLMPARSRVRNSRARPLAARRGTAVPHSCRSRRGLASGSLRWYRLQQPVSVHAEADVPPLLWGSPLTVPEPPEEKTMGEGRLSRRDFVRAGAAGAALLLGNSPPLRGEDTKAKL